MAKSIWSKAQGRISKEKVSVLFFGGQQAALDAFMMGAKTTEVYPKTGEYVVKFESGLAKVFSAEDFENEFAIWAQ